MRIYYYYVTKDGQVQLFPRPKDNSYCSVPFFPVMGKTSSDLTYSYKNIPSYDARENREMRGKNT